MEKTAIEQLINNRPKVYGWLGFQRFLLWLFLLSGLAFFTLFIYNLIMGLVRMILVEQLSIQIAHKIEREDLKDEIGHLLQKHIGSLQLQLVLYTLLISFSFFIAARYCQKVLNRNRYILELEKIITTSSS